MKTGDYTEDLQGIWLLFPGCVSCPGVLSGLWRQFPQDVPSMLRIKQGSVVYRQPRDIRDSTPGD